MQKNRFKEEEVIQVAVDPVCKMEVCEKEAATRSMKYNDKTYYFCTSGCRVAFQKGPERYLQRAGVKVN